VTAALVVITGLSWAYLVFLSVQMGEMGSSFAMPMAAAWTGQQILLMWTMWAVMMAGMMLPSAAPMISAYSTTIRSGPIRAGTPSLHGSTAMFIVSYLATWSGFAVLATGAQWALHDATLVSPMGVSTSRWLGGALLLVAGVYQFTGAKNACLRQCRTPLSFLLNHWQSGGRGALVMGLRHGAVCVGCCWALMAVLFVLGVMNLWWIALVAAVVLVEKLVPSQAITRILGGSLVLWGAALLAGLGS
jgi:predicted metal-binding membrane protein